MPAPIELYTLMNQPPDSKKCVSRFVDLFTAFNPTLTQNLKEAWERDLGVIITDEDWSSYLKDIHKCSINSRHQLIQFKVLHRLHYSCTKLHSFYPSVSPYCPKCKSAEGNLGHLFWSCPKLNRYWSDISACLSIVYDCDIVLDPYTAVFGKTSHLKMLHHLHRKTIQYGMIIAKRNILTLWKSEDAPSFKIWLAEMSNLLHMEKVRYNVSLNSVTFDKTWHPFLSYLSRIS